MAGTYGLNLFDRLHIGHQALIDTLAHMPSPVAVVTGGEIVGKGLDLESIIQPVDERPRFLLAGIKLQPMQA